MNKHISSFFVINKENRTIAFGSNLKELQNQFANVEPKARNYQYYYRKFLKESEFEEGEYKFQKLI